MVLAVFMFSLIKAAKFEQVHNQRNTQVMRLNDEILKFQKVMCTLIIICLYLPLTAKAFPEVSMPGCHEAIASTLGQWGSIDLWNKTLGEGGKLKQYSATDKIGVWILIDSDEEDHLELQRIEASSVTSFKYQSGKCKPDIALLKIPKYPDKETKVTDADIERLVRESRNGAIYTWSPAMPFSVDGIAEITKMARLEKIKLLIVLDPSADKDLAKRILKSKKLPMEFLQTSDSTELKFRRMYDHYPSCIFFKNGVMSDLRIPGLKLAHGYKQEFEALK